MPPERPVFHVAIPVYPKVDLLDVAAPCEIFSWMGAKWAEKEVRVRVVAASKRTLTTRDGLPIRPHLSFGDCRRQQLQFDLLWVPGGDPGTLQATMQSHAYLTFLRTQARRAAYVTSVCEGALLLASAGLLDGYEATTHWAFVPCLKAFPGVCVADGYPRFVEDRNRVTGGGISSGLDEALHLVARIAGYDVAQQVQQLTQYYPAPPVASTIPAAGDCPIQVPAQPTTR